MVSEQIKPSQLAGQAVEFKFESKLELLQVIWPLLPTANMIPENIKDSTTKSMAKLFRKCSSTALGDLTLIFPLIDRGFPRAT